MNTQYDKSKEERLLNKLKSGNKEALSEIYFLYWESLYDTALFILKDNYQAEDTVHDVFLTFWNSRNKIEVHTSLKAYLTQSIRYECYKIIKNKKKYTYIDEEPKEIGANFITDHLDSVELSAKIDHVLNRMPSKSQKIFFLSREKDLTYSEIAQKLGLTVKAVEYHISKVLKALKSAIYILLTFFLG
ncbi:sigma-70 family RNA polymerase sigma factor [Sphingobacterium sp. UT-1RO-CII-1]|uniref:RNA polymerase sigma factor n=1 Tax=Sphingobacterium sp. UT-1RO-CII-1 TaxID=2995225 RepID=UPI00227C7EB1|nr:sigma-70 family RNA polymerase sigma factor [Sphingobacterium sp. UT-1RO-CII-1]MCY4778658.1 sigma-70 family RNA polymerase sigma factor [Sphingobacterium sp. UT-1RO-CII-1]